MNKDIKAKDNNQKPKDACPAGTEADSELQPKITTSCPASSNTFVTCWPLSPELFSYTIIKIKRQEGNTDLGCYFASEFI